MKVLVVWLLSANMSGRWFGCWTQFLGHLLLSGNCLQEGPTSLRTLTSSPTRSRWSSSSMWHSDPTHMLTPAPPWRKVSWETLSPRNLSLRGSLVVPEKEPSLLSWVQSTKTLSRLPSKSLASTWWLVTWSHWTEPSVIYAMKSKFILTTSFPPSLLFCCLF